MRFHTHFWQEVRRVMTPPVPGLSGQGIPTRLVEQALFGFTTIELQCKICKDLKHHTQLGNLAVPGQ